MQTKWIPKSVFIAAVLTLALAACQSDSSSTPDSPAASRVASVSCSAESHAKLVKATDILFSRGFDPAVTESFLYGSAEQLGCSLSSGEWREHFSKKAPAGYTFRYRRYLADVGYDIRTGKAYDLKDPAATAASFPACYSQDDPFKRCRPAYHPLSGCKLDAGWKKFCTMKESMDGCWAGAKADIITAPPSRSAQASRIQLAGATRLGGGAAATPSQTAKPRPAAAASANMCQPLD